MPDKILIIDDSVENRQLLLRTLLKGGYEVIEAGDGKEGLSRAIEILPELILLDIVMPEIDGYQVCEALKKDSSRVFYIPQNSSTPNYTPILNLAVQENYWTAIDKEKPTTCYQARAFGHLKISLDFKVVPGAGLEPARGEPRGILSPLRLPVPPPRHFHVLLRGLVAAIIRK
jgi:CheY-like chemotaxis protein